MLTMLGQYYWVFTSEKEPFQEPSQGYLGRRCAAHSNGHYIVETLPDFVIARSPIGRRGNLRAR